MVDKSIIDFKLDQIIMLGQARDRLEASKILESKWIWSEVAKQWFLRVGKEQSLHG